MQNLNVSYATIKTILNTIPSYYVPQGDGGYEIYAVGDELFVRANIAGGSPDKADFEALHKSMATSTASADDAKVLGNVANKVPLVAPRAGDGRPTVRVTTANRTKNFCLNSFEFVPGDKTSLHNRKMVGIDFVEANEVTMTCYGPGNVVTIDPAVAIKTVLDLEPPYNYEVIGGWVDVPPGVQGGNTGQWIIGVIGIPDLPTVPWGGSVPFVRPTNLECVYETKIVSDGRATQYLTYNPIYHTNKLRWILTHPPSTTGRFQVYVETFTG